MEGRKSRPTAATLGVLMPIARAVRTKNDKANRPPHTLLINVWTDEAPQSAAYATAGLSDMSNRCSNADIRTCVTSSADSWSWLPVAAIPYLPVQPRRSQQGINAPKGFRLRNVKTSADLTCSR